MDGKYNNHLVRTVRYHVVRRGGEHVGFSPEGNVVLTFSLPARNCESRDSVR